MPRLYNSLTKGGGGKTPALCFRVWKVWKIAIQNNITLKAAHLAAHSFELKRRSSIEVKGSTYRMVYEQSGTESNIQLLGKTNDKSICFEMESQGSDFLFLDSRSESSSNKRIVNFLGQDDRICVSSICLIQKILSHMKQFQCKIILIAPQWPRRHWYTVLLQMLIDTPTRLLPREDMLVQSRPNIYHPDLKIFNLTAWHLSTEN